MPSDRFLRAMNGVHRLILRMSRGRLGWHAAGMPVLELTTTGRRSGQKRTAMLTSPVQVGGSYVVVASRGGDDTHPAWFLNLRDDPHVEVVLRGAPSVPMLARVATAEERAELWPRVTRSFRNYAGYQKRTDREIPLVFLDPV
ncbi:MAG: nitroreductase family deazaflavin-dependent oxidoreductase [Burkholderiaceae bacterium]|nr:nitroreductase family deazaflavin-dependent oxidoreductase [Microbacteriaceae bacterium]